MKIGNTVKLKFSQWIKINCNVIMEIHYSKANGRSTSESCQVSENTATKIDGVSLMPVTSSSLIMHWRNSA